MEKLKSLVPDALKEEIGASTPDDLPSTCSSLLNFFQQLPQFHQLLGDLTNPEIALCKKDQKAALELKFKGNQCFSMGDYNSAVRFYSQALRVAPLYDDDDMDKSLLATLYVNRATSFQKRGLMEECLRDCRRALLRLPYHAKAWFRRGQANAFLGNFEDAIRDLSISLGMETSSSGKRQIRHELNCIFQKSDRSSKSLQNFDQSTAEFCDEPVQNQLQCASTSNKGRGIVSETDIPKSSLIHKEEPYAAIILKHCRETHCHFCFSELPSDIIPCESCSIPLYCSEKCLGQAGGQMMDNIKRKEIMQGTLTDDLEHYLLKVTSISSSRSLNEQFPEHRHECQGVHWPAVLPPDVALAGRILVKYLTRTKSYISASHLTEILDLCHNYTHIPSDSRLELHIYAIILLHCLRHAHCSKLPLEEDSASQIVIILSQIRVNSMAIVHMNAVDDIHPLGQCLKNSSAGVPFTNIVEQVRVGQAIYLRGSLFNHSCQPNTHAYFLSRTLCIRATESVTAGSHLELSYGPQVGQQNCSNRQEFLQNHYSFTCQCTGCSELNLSDLVISSYRCIQPNCFGVVLENSVAKYEKQKLNCNSRIQDNNRNDHGSDAVAHEVFDRIGYINQSDPGYCSNCGSYLDLETASSKAGNGETHFKRLQDAVALNEVSPSMLLGGLRFIDLLRRTLHPFNKRIAEVEDTLAQAYCLLGEMKAALNHCQSSIEILEKLYGPHHIAIGNELLKLASIQVSIGDSSAVDIISRVAAIFSRYYGSHMYVLLPYLQSLIRDSGQVLG